jgi:hypothetical protein
LNIAERQDSAEIPANEQIRDCLLTTIIGRPIATVKAAV